jgi:hypothetical protein
MKKTAVEWFASQIKGGQLITNQKFKELLEQAKEMEKEQITDAFSEDNYECKGYTKVNLSAEQYYNETFKSE